MGTIMADEAQLNTYKSQLQQVEASLTSDPDNQDLLKLKKDLQEGIELTLQLLNIPGAGSPETEDGGESGGIIPIATEAEPADAYQSPWGPGDSCLAIWSDDGQYC